MAEHTGPARRWGPCPAARFWAFPLLVYAAVALACRLPAFFLSVVDWDETLYLLIADDVRAGFLPYERTWDHKQPGIFYVFALASALLGEGVIAIRILGLACAAGGALLTHRFTERAWRQPGSGWLAGGFYLAQTSIHGGQATNTEIVFSLFTLLAFGLALRALRQPGGGARHRALWAAGAAGGIAFAIKLVTAFDLLGLAILVALSHSADTAAAPGTRVRRVLADGVQLALPFAAVNLAFVLPHLAGGRGGLLYESAVAFNLRYGSDGPSSGQIARGLATLLPLFPGAILASCALALWDRVGARRARRRLLAVWIWLGLALAAVVFQRKLLPHHFLQLAPPLSILFGVGGALLARPALERSARAGAWVLAALLALGLAHPLARLQYDHQRLARSFAHGDAHETDLPRKIADAIVAASGSGASVYVYNDHPIVYRLVQTRAPTRFPFPLHLIAEPSPIPGLDRQAEFLRILATEPEWIVVRDDPLGPRFWDALQRELQRHYREHVRFSIERRDEEQFHGLIYRARPTGRFVRAYRRTPPETDPRPEADTEAEPRAAPERSGRGGRPTAARSRSVGTLGARSSTRCSTASMHARRRPSTRSSAGSA